jgi:hypothetical protein
MEQHDRDVFQHLADLQRLADSLVYELYLSEAADLQGYVSDMCESVPDTSNLSHLLMQSSDIRTLVDRLSTMPEAAAIDNSPRVAVPISQIPMLK